MEQEEEEEEEEAAAGAAGAAATAASTNNNGAAPRRLEEGGGREEGGSSVSVFVLAEGRQWVPVPGRARSESRNNQTSSLSSFSLPLFLLFRCFRALPNLCSLSFSIMRNTADAYADAARFFFKYY